MAKEIIEKIRAAEEEALRVEQEAKHKAQQIIADAQKEGAKFLKEQLAAEKERSEKALASLEARNEEDAKGALNAAADELAELTARAEAKMPEAAAEVLRILTE